MRALLVLLVFIPVLGFAAWVTVRSLRSTVTWRRDLDPRGRLRPYVRGMVPPPNPARGRSAEQPRDARPLGGRYGRARANVRALAIIGLVGIVAGLDNYSAGHHPAGLALFAIAVAILVMASIFRVRRWEDATRDDRSRQAQERALRLEQQAQRPWTIEMKPGWLGKAMWGPVRLPPEEPASATFNRLARAVFLVGFGTACVCGVLVDHLTGSVGWAILAWLAAELILISMLLLLARHLLWKRRPSEQRDAK